MKVRLKNVTEIITMLLLALFAVSFRGNDIIFLFILGMGAIISCIIRNKIILNIEIGLLILTFFSYYFIFLLRGSQYFQVYYVFRYFLAPVFAYIFGYVFTKGNYKRALKIFITVAIGRMLHGLLNISVSLNNLTLHHRSVIDYWTGGEYVATLQATYFIFAIAVGAWLLLKPRFMHKAIGAMLLLLSLLNALVTSSRTVIVMVAVLIAYIIIFNNNKNIIKKGLTVLFLFLMIFVVYHYNLFGIGTLIEQSNLMQRMIERGEGFLSTTRIELSIQVLRSLFDYPFGDMPFKYAHNIWLDIARQAGIIPFVLIVLYSVKVLCNLYHMNKRKMYSSDVCMLINLLYLTTFMDFFVEPILEGAPIVFYIFCMFNGTVNSLVKPPVMNLETKGI